MEPVPAGVELAGAAGTLVFFLIGALLQCFYRRYQPPRRTVVPYIDPATGRCGLAEQSDTLLSISQT